MKYLVFLAVFIGLIVVLCRRALAQQAKIDEAIKASGIATSEVEREGPVYGGSGKNLTIDEMVKGKTFRYALPRKSSGAEWEMLQRDAAAGAQLPNDYLVRTSGDPGPILDRLRPIAERMSEGVFEAEATKTEVAIFSDTRWSKVDDLLALLRSLDF